MNNDNTYFNQIQSIKNISFEKIFDLAFQNLPIEKRVRPWSFINHGIDLLHSEDDMNCYLAAYGKMHEAKIRTALASINNPEEIFKDRITVIDWGCGQGLATVCLLDFLKENNIQNNIQKTILIEPSKEALNRAKINVNVYLNDETKVKTVNKFLNDIESSDISSKNPVTFHFFSNILDITSIDLKKLAKLIEENIQGEHYFVCVGPLNFKSTRIEEFAEYINISQKQIIENNQGKLKHTRGTIKLFVFKIKGEEIEIIKTDFYPPIPNNINYISMIEKILNKINPSEMNSMDRIIQFYKTVVELERQKEPKIQNYFPYRIDGTSNTISIDIQQNTDFKDEFIRNSNPQITRWPKDLFIGLNATLNDETYTLLQYIIPFDDLRDFDIANNNIPIQVSNFEVSLKSLQGLELSDEQITELEERIKNEETISGISEVLKKNIDNISLDSNILYLALSSKNPALSQIYSELNKINNRNIQNDSLLEKFLLNKKINNKINNLTKDDLIQISNLDESQKNAVLDAFNNRLSVITGPPGSGKTQVILNILANALLQNKKVLVASKNNKAVDNVKERFDKIDDTGFFLRFGSKRILSENTIPAIERIINLQTNLEDNSQIVNDLKNKIEFHKNVISDNNAKLTLRKFLINNKLPEIKREIERNKYEINEIEENNSSLKFFKNIGIQNIDNYNSKHKIKRNVIEQKSSGIKKIWFNLFSKKKYIQELLNTIEEYSFDIKSHINKQNFKSQFSDFKNADDIIELHNQLISIFTQAIEYIQKHKQLTNKIKTLENKLLDKQNTIDEITRNEQVIKENIKNSKKEIIKLGKPLAVELIKNKVYKASIPSINNYKDYLPDNIPWRYEEVDFFTETTKSFLDIFSINSVTSLSAKAAFPLENELFDMVVIDEASQCDIASAIPLIFRTKQLVIIGDPLQLKHISMINNYEETVIKEKLLISNSAFLQYSNKSLWDYSKDLLSLTTPPNNVPVMIDSHYRCHPHIIGYSNEAFYQRYLAKELKIYTTDEQFTIEPKGIVWINVKGEQKANNININLAEVEKSIELAINLARQNNSISIGIITPFRHQAEQLNYKITNELRNRITADTVFKFQGDEKDIIIYSTVITNNSPKRKINWIDNSVPYLVNVAITRARNTLYIVGNKDYIKLNSSATKPLGKLAQYVDRI